VDLLDGLKSLRVNRDKRLLFPTPESPITTTAHEQHFVHRGGIHGTHKSWPKSKARHPKVVAGPVR
jgi:hypothetical protein